MQRFSPSCAACSSRLGAAPGRLRIQLLVETVTLGVLGGAAGILTAAAALTSSVAFGAAPAWQLSRTDLRTALGGETRGSSSRRTGQLIVASEIALAFAVLVGAGLLVRSFARVTAVDPRFDVGQRVTIRLSLTYAMLAAVLMVMAVAAAWLPARRAACIKPQLLMNSDNQEFGMRDRDCDAT